MDPLKVGMMRLIHLQALSMRSIISAVDRPTYFVHEFCDQNRAGCQEAQLGWRFKGHYLMDLWLRLAPLQKNRMSRFHLINWKQGLSHGIEDDFTYGRRQVFCVRFLPEQFLQYKDSIASWVALSSHCGQMPDMTRAPSQNSYLNARTWIEQEISKLPVSAGSIMLVAALRQMHATSGRQRIAPLAKEIGISERQLQRIFNRELGVKPDDLRRRYRFQSMLEHLLANATDQSLTELAYQYGFCDQAHLIREFRCFMKMTPTQFIKSQSAELPGC